MSEAQTWSHSFANNMDPIVLLAAALETRGTSERVLVAFIDS